MLNTTAKKLATGLVLSGLIYAAPALAQSALAQQSTTQQGSKSSTTKAPTAKSNSSTAKSTASNSTTSKSSTTAKKAPPKPLVYVEDNRSTKTADASASKSGDTSTSKNANGSTGKTANVSAKKPSDTSASPKPLSADVTKAFAQNCPSVALTATKSKAAYEVTFERDPGSKGVKSAFGLHKSNRIEVMSKGGKELFSASGHSTGQLVKDACTAMGTPSVKVAKN
jgi:glucose/arabinose dehydrogenase